LAALVRPGEKQYTKQQTADKGWQKAAESEAALMDKVLSPARLRFL
jgi:hypothetical protein